MKFLITFISATKGSIIIDREVMSFILSNYNDTVLIVYADGDHDLYEEVKSIRPIY